MALKILGVALTVGEEGVALTVGKKGVALVRQLPRISPLCTRLKVKYTCSIQTIQTGKGVFVYNKYLIILPQGCGPWWFLVFSKDPLS